MHQVFHHVAKRASDALGSPGMFILALILILSWAASGEYFGYSDTWQLVINTSTTIITFLSIFLIQNTQNRDAKATHLKIDELIRVARTARNTMLDLENLSDAELDELHAQYVALSQKRGRGPKNGTGLKK